MTNTVVQYAKLLDTDLEGTAGTMQWQSPQGRICYSFKDGNHVVHKIGCFSGTTEEAVRAIRKKYGEDSMYEQLLLLNTKALEER